MSITDFIHEIEVRTAIPGVSFTYDLRTPSDPRMRAVLEAIKPVVLLRGPLGNFRVDYTQGVTGQVSREFIVAGQKSAVGLVAGVAGVGLLLKALISRR